MRHAQRPALLVLVSGALLSSTAVSSSAGTATTPVATTTTAGPAVFHSEHHATWQGMPYWEFTVTVTAADDASLTGAAVDDYVQGPTSSVEMGGMCTPLSASGTSTCRILAASTAPDGRVWYGGAFPATGRYRASRSEPQLLPLPSPLPR